MREYIVLNLHKILLIPIGLLIYFITSHSCLKAVSENIQENIVVYDTVKIIVNTPITYHTMSADIKLELPYKWYVGDYNRNNIDFVKINDDGMEVSWTGKSLWIQDKKYPLHKVNYKISSKNDIEEWTLLGHNGKREYLRGQITRYGENWKAYFYDLNENSNIHGYFTEKRIADLFYNDAIAHTKLLE